MVDYMVVKLVQTMILMLYMMLLQLSVTHSCGLMMVFHHIIVQMLLVRHYPRSNAMVNFVIIGILVLNVVLRPSRSLTKILVMTLKLLLLMEIRVWRRGYLSCLQQHTGQLILLCSHVMSTRSWKCLPRLDVSTSVTSLDCYVGGPTSTNGGLKTVISIGLGSYMVVLNQPW